MAQLFKTLATAVGLGDLTRSTSEVAPDPETFGIDSGLTQALVDSIIDIQWPLLGRQLKATEASNLSFEYQALRTLLADATQRQKLFPFVPTEAVQLAAPSHGIDRERTLEAMGAQIEAFAKQWLQAPGNRTGGTTDPSVAAVNNAFTALYAYLAGATDQRVSPTEVRRLTDAWVAAASALPSAYDYLKSSELMFAELSFDFGVACASTASDALACADAGQKIVDAQTMIEGARARAAQASAETAGQFYQRFLLALAAFITDTWDNHHDQVYSAQAIDQATLVSFSTVVVRVDVHDGVISPQCCLSAAEIAATRRGHLYLANGDAVKFGQGPGGQVDGVNIPDVPLVRMDLEARPLSSPRGTRLAGPVSVLTRPVSGSVDAFLIGCSTADAACMDRLARSRVDPAGGTPLLSNGFSVLASMVAGAGGIGEGVSTLKLAVDTASGQ